VHLMGFFPLADSMNFPLPSHHSLNILGLSEEIYQIMHGEYYSAKAFCHYQFFRDIHQYRVQSNKIAKSKERIGLSQRRREGTL
jgi:hypothetical protein